MAQTPPPVIDAAPPAPDRSNRLTFALLAQNFTIWMKNAVAQFAAVALNVYNNALDAYANTQSAAASAAAAQAIAGAVLFNPATNYGAGQAAVSGVNWLLYRRKAAGISATDPSADAANWAPSGLPPVVLVRAAANFTAVAGVKYILTVNDIQMTMPLAPGAQDIVSYRLGVGVTRAVVKGNGNKLEGLAVGTDLAIDIPSFRSDVIFNATDGWLHF